MDDKILLSFCREGKDDDSWIGLHKPWIQDGWKYALEGRIGIRLPTSEPDTVDELKRPQQILDIFMNFPPCCEDLFPQHDGKMKSIDCGTCKHTGKMFVDCGKCNASGLIKCNKCGNEKDCEDCDGLRYTISSTLCPICNGSKYVDIPGSMMIGNRMIAGELIKKINSLGEVKHCLAGGKNDCLYFSAANGLQGAVMPLEQ